MEDKSTNLVFPDMENYYVTTKMIPDIYGYVKAISTVVKDHANEVYQVVRTLEYKSTFNGLRDRMYSGVIALYNKVFVELKEENDNGYPLLQGDLKNYFCVAIERANDTEKQILDFDMHFFQVEDVESLFKNEKFEKIPGIKDDSKYISIFNFGKQYEKDFDKINATGKIYKCRCYKKIDDGLTRHTLLNDELYDRTNIWHRKFVNELFTDLDLSNYVVGISIKEE